MSKGERLLLDEEEKVKRLKQVGIESAEELETYMRANVT